MGSIPVMTKQQAKAVAEAIVGKSLTMRVCKLSGSMRGYVTLSLRGRVDTFSRRQMDALGKEFARPDPTPSFVNTYSVYVYIGSAAYNP